MDRSIFCALVTCSNASGVALVLSGSALPMVLNGFFPAVLANVLVSLYFVTFYFGKLREKPLAPSLFPVHFFPLPSFPLNFMYVQLFGVTF